MIPEAKSIPESKTYFSDLGCLTNKLNLIFFFFKFWSNQNVNTHELLTESTKKRLFHL